MLLDDPELPGVAAVLFDEFHERSLDGDFGLALALDVQGALRPDLRLLVMSATLDGARVAQLLHGAPVIESAGRAFPVDIRYAERPPGVPVEDAMAGAIRTALAEENGSLLAFLPGQREILRRIGKGESNKEIAADLGISVKTVETHRARMMESLGCRRANDLLLLAARHQHELE